MEQDTSWGFVKSPRFWQLFIVGVMAGLYFALPGNVWVQALSISMGVWFGGSVTVRTIDRASDKKVEVAKIEADAL